MNDSPLSRQEILQTIVDLERWLDRHEWRAYEPHDGLKTPLRRLCWQNRHALLALKQVVLRSPWNLRPVLGIRAHTSPEALAFFGRGYLRLAAATGEATYRDRARNMLDRLVAAAEPGYSGLCWGNKFDYITRFFYLPAGTPIIVWTAHNAHVLLDAYEQLGSVADRDSAASAARFIVTDLPKHVEGDTVCLSYVPTGDHPVHNANVLGAALLARVSAHTGDAAMADLARRAMAYTIAHQRSDGSWWYAEAPNLHWVDNFHTGYVLDSLATYRNATSDRSFDDAIARGLTYLMTTFFGPDGQPYYYSDRMFPADIQCAAQAIETMLLFDHVDGARTLATRVARWTIAHMRDPSGYFYHRGYRRWTSRTPLLHWGQATMFSALAGLLEKTA